MNRCGKTLFYFSVCFSRKMASATLNPSRLASTMVSNAFTQNQIVPDVISKAPEKKLTVSYDCGVKAELGNVLTPTQVQNKPSVQWEAAANQLYTLILTDPDAPSRKEPKFREWHHWLVCNIPGNDISKGQILADYIGSGPPQGTGLHRYVFLLFKQAGKLEDKEHGHLPNNSGENRGGFKTADFVNKHKLGHPEAGAFYQAEYDDYVPKLYAKLG